MIIEVEFESRGMRYYYNSTFLVHIGMHVVVNVGGSLKVVKVMDHPDEDDISFSGPLKTIVGIVYKIEDLEQPIIQNKPTLFQTIANHFAK